MSAQPHGIAGEEEVFKVHRLLILQLKHIYNINTLNLVYLR